MATVPAALREVMVALKPCFSMPVWERAKVLVLGAVLCPGRRTVCGVLRVMGLGAAADFQNYHRVLNRARWSGLALSRLVLQMLVGVFAREKEVVVGVDEFIERRWGNKIAARSMYRDPVRSSHARKVHVSGLRWLSMMLLAEVPFARSVWALPFLTVPAPSAGYYEKKGRTHKKVTERSRQMLGLLKRFLPKRKIVLVADSGFAAHTLLSEANDYLRIVTPLRLDAALYELPPQKRKGRGRPAVKGTRLPLLSTWLNKRKGWTKVTVAPWYSETARTLEYLSGVAVWYCASTGQHTQVRWVLVRDPRGELKPHAFLCTKFDASPCEILTWYAKRWQVEVTFEEARAHLGIETQRQWSELAIARTTPCLLGLFSIVTLAAHKLRNHLTSNDAAWYQKPLPTFSDALATVRTYLWKESEFSHAPENQDTVRISRAMLQRLTHVLAYAA